MPIQRCAAGGEVYAQSERAQWPPSAAGGAGVHRRECRRLAAETPVPTGKGKRGQDTNGFLSPLDSPKPSFKPRRPSVARQNARGSQGRSVLQGYILDGSGAFRSANLTPCTVWPRTVMRGNSRKVNSGHNSVPKSARRTEPSPTYPLVSLHISDVSARRKVRGVKRGQETMFGVLSPFAPVGGHRHPPPPKAAMPSLPIGSYSRLHRLRRCIGGTAYPLLRVRRIFKFCLTGGAVYDIF